MFDKDVPIELLDIDDIFGSNERPTDVAKPRTGDLFTRKLDMPLRPRPPPVIPNRNSPQGSR